MLQIGTRLTNPQRKILKGISFVKGTLTPEFGPALKGAAATTSALAVLEVVVSAVAAPIRSLRSRSSDDRRHETTARRIE